MFEAGQYRSLRDAAADFIAYGQSRYAVLKPRRYPWSEAAKCLANVTDADIDGDTVHCFAVRMFLETRDASEAFPYFRAHRAGGTSPEAAN